jgi:hypothetical protein
LHKRIRPVGNDDRDLGDHPRLNLGLMALIAEQQDHIVTTELSSRGNMSDQENNFGQKARWQSI